MTTVQFEGGKWYSTRAAGDHNLVWNYKVIKRTRQNVWLQVRYGKVERHRVKVVDGVETCLPDGNYAKAPVLKADREQTL